MTTYTWTDDTMRSGSTCEVDKVADNLMHLKYENILTPFAINSGNVDISGNANVLAISTNDKVYYPNYSIVGTPTITNYLASGLSTSNYLKLPSVFNPSNSAWEIVTKFTTGSTLGATTCVLSNYDNSSPYLCLILRTSNKMSYQATGITTIEGTTTILPNTAYYVKYEYTGYAYNGYTSTDGTNWTLEGSVTSSTPITTQTNVLYIGNQPYSSGLGYLASVDLKESYIKVNGKIWWSCFSSATLLSNVGGSYPNLIATQANRKQFIRTGINPLNCSQLANGTYNVFVGESGDAYVLKNTVFTQPNQPMNSQGTLGDNLIPTMTSVTTPTGTVTSTGGTWTGADAYKFFISATTPSVGYGWGPTSANSSVTYTFNNGNRPSSGNYRFAFDFETDQSGYCSGRILSTYSVAVLYADGTTETVYSASPNITTYGSWTNLVSDFIAKKDISAITLSVTGGVASILGVFANACLKKRSLVANDIWVKTLEPLSAYKYDGTTWNEFLDVLLGQITVASNLITSVIQPLFNQNGYDVNVPTLNNLSGYRFPDYSRGVNKACNTTYKAECDGELYYYIQSWGLWVKLYVSVDNLTWNEVGGGAQSITSNAYVYFEGMIRISKGEYYKLVKDSQNGNSSCAGYLTFFPVKGAN